MPKSHRIEITTEIREALLAEKARTGVAANKLLRGKRKVIPEGLTSSMITGWMIGSIGSAKSEHLAWVADAYANYTPPKNPKDTAPERIKLGADETTLIQSEAKRTGLGAIDILRHAPKPLPDGLNHQKVQRWISGQTKSAQKHHWKLVLDLYAKID